MGEFVAGLGADYDDDVTLLVSAQIDGSKLLSMSDLELSKFVLHSDHRQTIRNSLMERRSHIHIQSNLVSLKTMTPVPSLSATMVVPPAIFPLLPTAETNQTSKDCSWSLMDGHHDEEIRKACRSSKTMIDQIKQRKTSFVCVSIKFVTNCIIDELYN